MDLAAFAALRQPLEVTVGGLLYDVDVPDLQGWARALHEPIPLLAVLPHPQAVRLNRRLRDDDVDLPELTRAWQDVLELSADFPWYVSERLLLALVDQWSTFAGVLGKRGVDALTLPLDMALSAGWAMMQEAAGDELSTLRLREQLWQPPEQIGREAAPRWSGQDEGAAWLQAASATANVPGVRALPG